MKHEPRPAIWKSILGGAINWWSRVSGDLQGGVNIVSQVDGVSDMAPACWLCGSVGGGFKKGTMNGLCPPFCPPALTLMPYASASPSMPLVPLKLLFCCWSSEGVSMNKFLHGFFKRNCLGLEKFLPPTQSLLVFAARSCGDLPSWYWNPGLGFLVWGWDSLLPRCSS